MPKPVPEHERLLALLVEQVNDAIIVTDLQFRIQTWNPAAEQMYGWRADEVVGKLLPEVLPAGRFLDGKVRTDVVQEIVATGHWSGEVIHPHRAGHDLVVESSVRLIRDEAGTAIGLIGVNRDSTLRHNIQVALRSSEERFRLLFEHSPDAIWLLDQHHPTIPSMIVHCNPAACEMHGYSREELIGRSITMLAVASDQDGQTPRPREMPTVLAHHGRIEDRHRRKDGSVVQVEFATSLVVIDGRELVLGIDRDVTRRNQIEEERRRSEAYFRALIEHADDIIFVLNSDGTLRYTSPAQGRILGQDPDERVGADAFGRIHPDDRPQMQRLLARLLTLPGESVRTELRVEHRNGSWRILEATATNLVDDPDIAGIVVNARDITERKAVEDQLVHDAMHDALTGLPNRTLFFDRLRQALDRAARSPERHFAVLFLDLDRFKTINESLGHLFGDLLLQEVARRLVTCVRPGDSVARLGGDEFALLLEEIDAAGAAVVVADRIHQALLAPVQVGEHALSVSSSIGITLSTPEHTHPDELLRAADIAMYRAKQLGKARSQIFDPTMLEQARMRLSLEAELLQAIDRDELVLHFQPIISVAAGTVQGVEALVRWQHPVRGLLAPGVFIPIAEETGLIVPLGAWVVRSACLQAAAWRMAGLPPWYIAVNLAALQLKQADLVTTLDQVLRETGLPPSALEIELTETNAMSEPQHTARVLADAQALGIHGVSIDDFGTGYSSLSYLQQFPITCVKIDRSFVRDLTTNTNNAALARAIIAMAHSLQLTVVAEGVETAAQLEFLRSYGCDAAQGYLFSAPLPAAALAHMVVGDTLRRPDPTPGGRSG